MCMFGLHGYVTDAAVVRLLTYKNWSHSLALVPGIVLVHQAQLPLCNCLHFPLLSGYFIHIIHQYLRQLHFNQGCAQV